MIKIRLCLSEIDVSSMLLLTDFEDCTHDLQQFQETLPNSYDDEPLIQKK